MKDLENHVEDSAQEQQAGRSSTAAHTPGPWRAAFEPESRWRETEFENEICCLGHMAFDAVDIFAAKRDAADPINCSWEEFQANAHLIAAAPDLLGLLKQAHKDLSYYAWYEGSKQSMKVAAAIAKAEGRT